MGAAADLTVSNPDTRRKYIGSAGIKNDLLPVSGQIGYKPHPAQVRGCLQSTGRDM